jgi:hypothetical protein
VNGRNASLEDEVIECPLLAQLREEEVLRESMRAACLPPGKVPRCEDMNTVATMRAIHCDDRCLEDPPQP